MGGAFRKSASAEEAIKKQEIAAGIRQPDPIMPYKPGEAGIPYPGGGVAREWPNKKLRDNSTGGSPSFSDAEIKQGYRKVR